MSPSLDDLLDDLFHSAAFTAFVEQARLEQGWPSVVATRERAYELYEAALAERNGPSEAERCNSYAILRRAIHE